MGMRRGFGAAGDFTATGEAIFLAEVRVCFLVFTADFASLEAFAWLETLVLPLCEESAFAATGRPDADVVVRLVFFLAATFEVLLLTFFADPEAVADDGLAVFFLVLVTLGLPVALLLTVVVLVVLAFAVLALVVFATFLVGWGFLLAVVALETALVLLVLRLATAWVTPIRNIAKLL